MSLADALTAARAIQQAALEEAMPAFGNPGSITIAGVDYLCAVSLSSIRPDLSIEGQGRIQTFRADVRKTLLTGQPAPDAVITVAGHDFFIDPDAGQGDNGDTWTIRGRRTV